MKDYTAPSDIHACLAHDLHTDAPTTPSAVDPLLLDVLPGAFLLVSPGTLEVRAASRAYCRLTGLSAAQVVGLPLLDLPTPHIADRAAALRWQDTLLQSITRMLATGQPDAMPELRVRDSASRHMLLAAMNVPVLREDRSVRCIVHRVEDVSGIVLKQDAHAAGGGESEQEDRERAFDVLVELADRTRALERANRRLESTQALIQRTVDSAAVGVLMLDPAHRVVLQNAAARTLLRATRVQLDEAPLIDLVHTDDRAALLTVLGGKADTAGIQQGLEIRPTWSVGDTTWLRFKVASVDRSHEEAYRLVLLEDITAARQLERQANVTRQRLESTLETMGDAFYILDRDWRFLYLNQEAEQLLQRSRDMLLGEQLWDVFPDTTHTKIWDAFHRAMRDRVSTSFEINYPQLGHWFQARAHPTDEGIAVYFQTIDDRKQAEITARAHAERFELVATASEAGIWDWQITQNTLHCSPRLKELLGGEPLPDLRTFRALRALVHPDDQSTFDAALHSHLEHLSVFNVECRIRCSDNVTRWFNVAGRASRDMSGRPLRMVGSMVDITRRRAAEEEARSLARRLTLTLESVTDAVFTLDREWRFGYLNSRAAALLEREPSDLVGRVVWEEFPVAVGSIFETEYRRAMSDGVPSMFEAHYPAPIDKWFHVSVYPSKEGLVVYFRDVTDSHQATRALRASEERFRLLSRATNDAIWDWDLVTNALWWNEGYETLFGRRRDEVDATIDSWTAYIHPEDVDRTVEEINEIIDGGGDHWTGQYRYLRADGSYAWVLDRGYVIRDADGVPMRMIGGMTDLTDRVMAEEQVAEQAALIDEASDAILVRDLSHRITFWNEGAKKVYGWSVEEAVGRHGGELLYADQGQFDRAMADLLRDGFWSGELEQIAKGGEQRLVFGRWTLMRDRAGNPKSVLAINADITDRRNVEQQLLRAQRLESIGTLAGGIAHDLNNVLTPILMSIEVLKLTEQNEAKLDVLSTIETSARRGADMVQQVLTFARGVEGERVMVRLEDVVGDVVKIAQETFPRSIAVSAEVPSGLPPVAGDATQLHQVLLNLCVNARDAMEQGGKLRVQLVAATIDAHYVALHPEAREGEYVVLQVEDSGSGMSPDVMDKMFEPFFTTKELGQGTGLGLSTTLAIVRSHGGFVRVYSELGRGTTFHVYLPALQASADSGESASREVELPRGYGELILVVDDEPAVRRITCHTLEAFGYRTLTAVDGADAIATYAARQADIALVLTDMMMPVMDGLSMVQVIRRMNPSVRIVAASGLQANNRVAKATELGVRHFLAKPYTADRLLLAIRDSLDSPGGPAHVG